MHVSDADCPRAGSPMGAGEKASDGPPPGACHVVDLERRLGLRVRPATSGARQEQETDTAEVGRGEPKATERRPLPLTKSVEHRAVESIAAGTTRPTARHGLCGHFCIRLFTNVGINVGVSPLASVYSA